MTEKALPAGGQNIEPASDATKMTKTVAKTMETGIKGLTAMDKLAKGMVKSFKEIEAIYKKLASEKGGFNSVGLGTAPMGVKAAWSNLGTGQKIGLGAAGAVTGGFGVGLAAMYAIAPNVGVAVAQRIAADSFAGLSGMSTGSYIRKMNNAVGNGATSAGGPTMAAGILASQGGYLASNSKYSSSSRVMGELGGLSAISGSTNESVAQGLAGINSMNFLRMGVQARDANGNLRSPSTMINSLYNSMYGGRKITAAQAQMVYNPGSKGYANLMMVSGGDQNLFNTLASGIVARAKSGRPLDSKTLGNAQKSYDLMGIEGGSPLRSQMKYNTAQNKMLQETESGLVGGYSATLSGTAAVTSGMADLARVLGPVTDGLMGLKGILQTLPGTGGVGQIASGLGGTMMSIGSMAMGARMMKGFGNAPAAGARSGMSMKMKGGLAGSAAALATGAITGQMRSGTGKKAVSILGNAGAGVLMGAGFGAPGMIIGGLLGGAYGAINSFDVGSENVSHDQVAMVHKGEMILTRSEAESARKKKSFFGGLWDFFTGKDGGVAKAGSFLLQSFKKADNILDDVKDFSTPSLGNFLAGLRRAVPKSVGNKFKHFVTGVFGKSNSGSSGPSGGPSHGGGSGNSPIGKPSYRAKAMKKWLMAKGLSENGAIGVVSNLMAESSMSPTAGGDGGDSYGIAQWNTVRKDQLFKFAADRNLDVHSIETQRKYLWQDLQKPGYANLMRGLTNPKTTALGATSWFAKAYEKPDDIHLTPESIQMRYNKGLGALKPIKGYAVGADKVDKDQIAMVHKDEMIIPAIQAERIRSGAGGGTNVNITMHVNIARASVQEAENMLQQFKAALAKDVRLNGMRIT